MTSTLRPRARFRRSEPVTVPVESAPVWPQPVAPEAAQPRGQAQKPAQPKMRPEVPKTELAPSSIGAPATPTKASKGLKPGEVRRAARFQHAACKTDGYLRQERDRLFLKVGTQEIAVTPLAHLALPPLPSAVHVNLWPRLDEVGALSTWLLSRVEVLEAAKDEELVVRVVGTLSGRDEASLSVTITPKVENSGAQPFIVRLWGPHGLLRALPVDGTPPAALCPAQGREADCEALLRGARGLR